MMGRCADCTMFLKPNRCTILGTDDAIRPEGTCKYFERGPATGGKPSGKYSKAEVNYTDNARSRYKGKV